MESARDYGRGFLYCASEAFNFFLTLETSARRVALLSPAPLGDFEAERGAGASAAWVRVRLCGLALLLALFFDDDDGVFWCASSSPMSKALREN